VAPETEPQLKVGNIEVLVALFAGEFKTGVGRVGEGTVEKHHVDDEF